MNGTYTHMAANATKVITTASAVLMDVIINTKGASANTLTIYDGSAASGTVVAVIDTTSIVTQLGYGCTCVNGVTAVMATGTAADVTIVTN